MKIWAGILALLAALGTLFRRPSSDGVEETLSPLPHPNFFDQLYKKYGALYDIDPRLLKAIAQVESDEGKHMIGPTGEFGLFQILCRPDSQGRCTAEFPAVAAYQGATRDRLLNDHEFNTRIACEILRWNIERYGLPKGIAVYNSWSARTDHPGGPFSNQAYVDKVLSRVPGGSLIT